MVVSRGRFNRAGLGVCSHCMFLPHLWSDKTRMRLESRYHVTQNMAILLSIQAT